jgi:RNA polymerase sporulation-specific sigma factor
MYSKEDELAFHWENYTANRNLQSRNWLYTRYHYLVRQTRLRMFPGYINWEDMEQEGTLALLRALDYFDPKRNVKFTVYAIRCIKECYSETYGQDKKRAQRTIPLFDENGNILDVNWTIHDAPNPEEQVVSLYTRRFVRRTVEALPPHLSEVLIKRYWEGKTLKEIAVELQRTAPSIFDREKTGFKLLRKLIPEDLFERY